MLLTKESHTSVIGMRIGILRIRIMETSIPARIQRTADTTITSKVNGIAESSFGRTSRK